MKIKLIVKIIILVFLQYPNELKIYMLNEKGKYYLKIEKFEESENNFL